MLEKDILRGIYVDLNPFSILPLYQVYTKKQVFFTQKTKEKAILLPPQKKRMISHLTR